MNIKGENGLGLEVGNVGRHDIPPYWLMLFHPFRGSMSMFSAEDQDKPLVPHEYRNHEAVLLRNGKPDGNLCIWMTHERNLPVEEPTVDDFTFRIVMKNSDRIMFESPQIGRALAIRLLHLFGKGANLKTSPYDLRTPIPLSSRVWDSIRMKIGLKTEEERMIERIEKEEAKKQTVG
jgi:hypothetical protein